MFTLPHQKDKKKSVGLYISYDLHKASEFKVRVQTEHKLPCYSYCTLHLHWSDIMCLALPLMFVDFSTIYLTSLKKTFNSIQLKVSVYLPDDKQMTMVLVHLESIDDHSNCALINFVLQRIKLSSNVWPSTLMSSDL